MPTTVNYARKKFMKLATEHAQFEIKIKALLVQQNYFSLNQSN